jgi:capsular exopolysaccharide synthesis family protein
MAYERQPVTPDSEPSNRRALARRTTTELSTDVLQPQFEAAEAEGGINLREYWEILVRRRWTVFIFFLIVVAATVVATFLTTSIYRATLTLQIERNAPKVVSYQNVTPMESSYDRDFYQTQYELLKSRALAERAVNLLGLAEHPLYRGRDAAPADSSVAWANTNPAIDQANAQRLDQARARHLDGTIAAFGGAVAVEPVRNSRLVKVHFDSPDAQLSANAVNTLAKAFIEMNLERRMDASSYAKKFLEERLSQMRARLEDSEKELVKYARQERIVNVDEKRSAVAQKMQELNTALARAEEERIKNEALYAQHKGAEGLGSMLILQSPVVQALAQIKAKLEAEYQDGLRVYKPAYPSMQRLKSQIDEIQAKIGQEAGQVRAAIKGDYQAAVEKERLLSAQLEQTKNELLTLQDNSIQYNSLKREADSNRTLYEGLLQRMKEVGVAGGIDVNNISIVDKAEVPTGRFKPSLRNNLLLAMFLGLFGGVGLAFLFEQVDDTLKTPEEAERYLGLPVLGVIPIVKEMAGVGEDDPKLALSAQTDPRSAFAEAYRSVRTALQFSTPEGAPRVLVVTSASIGEGKSTTSLSLAIHFAQTGGRVLLIDADLRKPSLHKSLKTDNGHGLTNYLAGEAAPLEITKPTFIPNLFFIPTGPLPPNPADLLASAKMVSLLSLATEKFQYVILDGPPVLGLSDAPILANMADGTIFVVEAASTRRGFAQNAVKRLRGARARVLGGIVTKLQAGGKSYAYYQHNYYYAYGEGPSSAKKLTA